MYFPCTRAPRFYFLKKFVTYPKKKNYPSIPRNHFFHCILKFKYSVPINLGFISLFQIAVYNHPRKLKGEQGRSTLSNWINGRRPTLLGDR